MAKQTVKRTPYKFGDHGVWHKPECDDMKAKDIPCRVLEDNNGLLHLFLGEPWKKGWNNLTHRTVTIFSSDFTPDP